MRAARFAAVVASIVLMAGCASPPPQDVDEPGDDPLRTGEAPTIAPVLPRDPGLPDDIDNIYWFADVAVAPEAYGECEITFCFTEDFTSDVPVHVDLFLEWGFVDFNHFEAQILRDGTVLATSEPSPTGAQEQVLVTDLAAGSYQARLVPRQVVRDAAHLVVTFTVAEQPPEVNAEPQR